MSKHGLRGSEFEKLINYTLDIYKENNLCLIQKIPTPITPVKLSPDYSQINLAYFEKKSTVDYIGAVQGIPVCFDAKECNKDSFSLYNIHAHQFEFMKNMEEQKGVSFILIYYKHKDIFYYMRFKELSKIYNNMIVNGKKSFKFSDLDNNFLFEEENGIVPFLDKLSLDLKDR